MKHPVYITIYRMHFYPDVQNKWKILVYDSDKILHLIKFNTRSKREE